MTDEENIATNEENNEELIESKTIFRKKSIENQDNLQQLDVMLNIISPKSWAILAGIGFILFSVLIWSLFGSIPVIVQGRGIVISSKGLFSVQSRVKGIVMQLHVAPGEIVKTGTLIAELVDKEKAIEQENAKIKYNKLQADLSQLKEEVSREDKASTIASEKDLSAKEYTVEQNKLEIEKLEKELIKRKKLVEEGLISKSLLDETEAKYYAKKIDLGTTEATIANIRANMVKGYRTAELKAKEQEVSKAHDDLQLLESTLNGMKIYSPVNGKVLDWLVNKGDLVNPGTSLVWMELAENQEDSPEIVLGYLPIERGKNVKVGNQVQIEMSTVNVQEFGYVLGVVEKVALYASSKQNIANVTKNEGLAEYLIADNEVVIQVIIKPEINPNTISGFKWSSGEGPPFKISTGTICTLRTTVERIRPFYYVLPIWKLKSIVSSESSEQEKVPLHGD